MKHDDDEPVWGTGIMEANFEYIEAQKRLNQLYGKMVESIGIRKPKPGQIERIIAESVRCEPIRYPEEVKMNGIEAQLRREMAKGKVTGHFC